MTFAKMMEAGRERREAIKAALVIKGNEIKRGKTMKRKGKTFEGKVIVRQAALGYKEAVREANLRYQKELSVKGGK
jgi:hypothetical protein